VRGPGLSSGCSGSAAVAVQYRQLDHPARHPEEPAVTILLDSGTDVVIVEGPITAPGPPTSTLFKAYNQKHDWQYQLWARGARPGGTEVSAGQANGGLVGHDSF
jgi:hypothetical protein